MSAKGTLDWARYEISKLWKNNRKDAEAQKGSMKKHASILNPSLRLSASAV